jgi:flagellar biosynthesis protein FliR
MCAVPKYPLEKLTIYLSYLLSAVFFVGGLFVILDVFNLSNVPTQMRVMLGIVLMLWAIYRFVITYTKFRQHEEEE